MKISLLAIGNALTDLEYRVTDLQLESLGAQKGRMELIDANRLRELKVQLGAPLGRSGGGSCANTLSAFAQLGGKAHFAFQVAGDDEGEFFLNDLRQLGIHYQASHVGRGEEGQATGNCLVLTTPDGQRTMLTHLGASEKLSMNNLDLGWMSNADHLFVEGYLVAQEEGFPAAVELIARARQLGKPFYYTLSDVNMIRYFPGQVQKILSYRPDFLFGNIDEVMALYGRVGDVNCLVDFMKSISESFALTRGEQGAIVYLDGTLFEVPAPKVQVVDTNGAGDMFAGVMLYEIIQNKLNSVNANLDQVQRAVNLASQVVTQMGARMKI